jgi:hypothetical protein
MSPSGRVAIPAAVIIDNIFVKKTVVFVFPGQAPNPLQEQAIIKRLAKEAYLLGNRQLATLIRSEGYIYYDLAAVQKHHIKLAA